MSINYKAKEEIPLIWRCHTNHTRNGSLFSPTGSQGHRSRGNREYPSGCTWLSLQVREFLGVSCDAYLPDIIIQRLL